MSSDQPSDQRTDSIDAAARIEVTWDPDAYCLLSTPVRMTGHNAVNPIGQAGGAVSAPLSMGRHPRGDGDHAPALL
jgi:hypothetical protein